MVSARTLEVRRIKQDERERLIAEMEAELGDAEEGDAKVLGAR
jgi:hypothetical protein